MEIKIFKNDEFGQIRTSVNPEGEPLFCAADVAKALGYSNPRKAIADHVEKDDVTKRDTIDSMGRIQQSTFVNESGLYALIFGSKLARAKEFKHWVTSEVLPSIRRHGAYMTETTLMQVMQRPESIILLLTKLKEETEENDRLRPKAEYADRVLDSVSCMTTTQVAKEMEMTAQELNRWLCDHGIQYRQSGQYLLYADYARRGFAQNRSHSYVDIFGECHTRTYLVWTERGREFIHRKVKGILPIAEIV